MKPLQTAVFGLFALAATGAAGAAEDGNWEIVPAVREPVLVAGTRFIVAWRINRKTGSLEMCSYDPGGWMNPTTGHPAPEELACTPQNLPK